MARVVGRFAPTPSGYLHLGNLFCSLIAWLAAKSQGGDIILRNEDLDRERTRQEYVLQARRELDALGLFWDQGGKEGAPTPLTTRASALPSTAPSWPNWRRGACATPVFAAGPSSTRPARPTPRTGSCCTAGPAGT